MLSPGVISACDSKCDYKYEPHTGSSFCFCLFWSRSDDWFWTSWIELFWFLGLLAVSSASSVVTGAGVVASVVVAWFFWYRGVTDVGAVLVVSTVGTGFCFTGSGTAFFLLPNDPKIQIFRTFCFCFYICLRIKSSDRRGVTNIIVSFVFSLGCW